MLTLQNNTGWRGRGRARTRATTKLGRATTVFDLDVVAERGRRRAGVRRAVTFAADMFDESVAAGIADRLVRVLAAVVADPGVRLRCCRVLGEVERRWVVSEWHGGDVVPLAGSVPGLFAEQVVRLRMRSRWCVEGVADVRASWVRAPIGWRPS